MGLAQGQVRGTGEPDVVMHLFFPVEVRAREITCALRLKASLVSIEASVEKRGWGYRSADRFLHKLQAPELDL